jgi:hypothetical protein
MIYHQQGWWDTETKNFVRCFRIFCSGDAMMSAVAVQFLRMHSELEEKAFVMKMNSKNYLSVSPEQVKFHLFSSR